MFRPIFIHPNESICHTILVKEVEAHKPLRNATQDSRVEVLELHCPVLPIILYFRSLQEDPRDSWSDIYPIGVACLFAIMLLLIVHVHLCLRETVNVKEEMCSPCKSEAAGPEQYQHL